MSTIISIHSFRGGTGKSNTTANVASLLAQRGNRVGVIDTDIQSPGIHVLFGMQEDDIKLSLNDYLWGKCAANEAAYDVTHVLGANPAGGVLYLIPSSIRTNEIARILKEGYDPADLNDGFNDLIDDLNLDYLMIDTHPGLNEETLLSIAVSDALLIVLRPDSQDYQGTGVTVQVARKLGVAKLLLLVNKVPAVFDPEQVRKQVESTYNCEVAAILPHSDDLMALASSNVFVLRYPDHPVAQIYNQLTDRLTRG